MNTISDTEQHITLEPYDAKRLASLCGQLDEHLRQIENRFSIQIYNRGNFFSFIGDTPNVQAAAAVLDHLYTQTLTDSTLTPEQIHLTIRERQMTLSQNNSEVHTSPSPSNTATDDPQHTSANSHQLDNAVKLDTIAPLQHSTESNALDTLIIKTGRTPIKPRGATQQHYVRFIRSMDVNFGIGPAGTGKTFLAVACALEALDHGDVRKIILTRPAVEAGEKLGFLPGNIVEKVNPYLRPLHDALYEMLGPERINKYLDRQIIEIAPLAYMRGRTLNHAFIILDEAQNTTIQQMKMFLTRLGFGSKAVITGDSTQVDLPGGTESGLHHAMRVLERVDGLGFTFFKPADVVRHSIVQAIVEAYQHASETTPVRAKKPNRRRSSTTNPEHV
ncbi:MAG: PhoH family protein [Gammaproteobacteria bacterium]